MNTILNKDSTAKGDSIKLLLDDELCSDSTKIANAFSDYFISKPHLLHNNIAESHNNYLNLIPFKNSSLILYPSTWYEVANIIKSLKKTSSLSEIPSQLLQLGCDYLAPLLSQLFNDCIVSGVFPDAFKLSNVTPLFKKGSRNSIENYRPISVLNNLHKIFERLVYTRLSSFVDSCRILSSNQFGFRSDSNTELASLKLIAKILPAILDKMYAIVVFLDFSSAFDTVTHELLFSKLWRYGVRGCALDFIKSYFSGRFQEVSVQGYTSDRQYINSGVLQGSILGPLFFNLYTNDINFALDNSDPILYADDTTLVFLSNDIVSLSLNVNNMLLRLKDWCDFNRLVVNSEKTKCMLITPRLNVVPPIIFYDQTQLSFVDSFKYLGVQFDSDLKFNIHIQFLTQQLSRICGSAYRLSGFFNLSTAKTFYYAYFYSIATYNIGVWGGIFQCSQRANGLLTLQRRIVKCLFSKFFNFPATEDLFGLVNILKLNQVYLLKVAILMYKVIKWNKYPTLRDDLKLQHPSHEYGTRCNDFYVLPFPRTEAIRISFRYQFIKIWNTIPLDIKNLPSLNKFKTAYKHYLLSI